MFAALAMATGGCTDGLDLSSVSSEIDIDAFVMPTLTSGERAEIVHRYDHLDPTDLVPRGLLEDAMVYLDMNSALIPKQAYFVVIDMSLHSGKDRFWLVDTTTGEVEPHKVAHGDGSDPDNDGLANVFGNVDGSHMSSLGFYLTGEIYDGTHIHSMRLDGLNRAGSPNSLENNNARSRLIVVHEASYVDDSNTTRQGRSNGCPALDPSIEVGVVDKIHAGSLFYMATSPLAPPVGRTDPNAGSGSGDPGQDPPPPDDTTGGTDTGGCSSTGSSSGAGFALALGVGLVGVRRRRR